MYQTNTTPLVIIIATPSRAALLETLAAAKTNLAIARKEVDTAWERYDETVELRALDMATNEDVAYGAQVAKDLDAVYFTAYARVDEIKAQLLLLPE